MLGDKIGNRFVQHFLLILAEVDAELLERDDGGIFRVVVTADVLLWERNGLLLFRNGLGCRFRWWEVPLAPP